MISFNYEEKEDGYSSSVSNIEAEHITEWFSTFFQFMLSAGWMPSQIENYIKETAKDLEDSDVGLFDCII